MTLIDDIRAQLDTAIAATTDALALLDEVTVEEEIPAFDWNIVSAPPGLWHFVAWSPTLKMWAACASFDNTVMTLEPGGQWTSRPAPSAEYKGIVWAADRFVAVSKSSTVIWSTDGMTWNTASAPNGNQWHDVAYSPTLDMAAAVAQAGSSERLMVSHDRGLTWTALTPPSPANAWHAIEWSHDQHKFTAVAENGDSTRAIVSSDGMTWTGHTAPQQLWKSLRYGNGKWVAISSTGPTMDSPNGENWTERAGVPGLWHDIEFGAGMFLAVCQVGTDQVMASLDGATWKVTPAPSGAWQGIAYAPSEDTFAVVGQFGDAMTGTRSQNPPAGEYSGTPYRYWELRTTATDGGSRVRINEMSIHAGAQLYPPVMTGPGAASATSEDSPRDAWKAFDGSITAEKGWWSVAGAPQSLYFDAGTPVTPEQLTLRADQYPQHTPKDFALIGHAEETHDGATETALLVSGETGWAAFEERMFTVSVT